MARSPQESMKEAASQPAVDQRQPERHGGHAEYMAQQERFAQHQGAKERRIDRHDQGHEADIAGS
jgi:hypothetical protein